MRFFLFLGFLFIIDLYSFQALKILNQQWSSLARTTSNVLFWAVPAVTFALFLASSYTDTAQWNRHLYTYARTMIFIAYVSKFLILPFLAIDDLRRIFQWSMEKTGISQGFNPSRSRFLSQFGMVIGSIPFLSLTYGMLRNPYRYKLFRTSIEVEDLPENLHGLRIVQISDIHSGSFMFQEPVKAAVELINAQQADLVFFTGDLVNSKAEEIGPFVHIFDKIQSKYGVFSVLGNHDYGDYHDWGSP